MQFNEDCKEIKQANAFIKGNVPVVFAKENLAGEVPWVMIVQSLCNNWHIDCNENQ